MIQGKRVFLLITLFLVCKLVSSQEIEQWRGPKRDGVFQETGLLKQWPAEGPKLLWINELLPKGYSSACVTPVGIFTTGIIDTMDAVIGMSLTGEIKWKTPYGRYWKASFSDSRCTPTFENNKLYVTSGNGDVACIDALTGSIIWKVNASEKFGGTYGEWGIAESILILGDKIFFTPGGPKTTLVALNKNTGETIWASETLNDEPGYGSPNLIEYGGRKLIVNITGLYLIAVDPDNGKIVWKVKYFDINSAASIKVWPDAPKINTFTPIMDNGYLYITQGYDHCGAMFKLADDASSASLVWTDSLLDVHHGGVIWMNGYIYGSNWTSNSDGQWCCIESKTGKKIYEQAWNCKGSIISADGLLYIYDEKKGYVGLLKPNPEKFDLVSSFKVPKGSGPHWAHPVIKDGMLYIRHGNALMAYNIKIQ